MRTAKTVIRFFAGRTCHFVGFVMWWLNYVYMLLVFIPFETWKVKCVFIADLETIKGYIDAFRYGAPPHAGGGIGKTSVIKSAFSYIHYCFSCYGFKFCQWCVNINRKVQGVPQSIPYTKRKRKRIETDACKANNAQEANRTALSSPGEVITMLNRTEKTRKQRARRQHKTPVLKTTKPNNHTKTTVLEWSVA